MKDCNYLLIRPNDLRKRFTDFVLMNQSRALLPSRTTLYGGGRSSPASQFSHANKVLSTRKNLEASFMASDLSNQSVILKSNVKLIEKSKAHL